MTTASRESDAGYFTGIWTFNGGFEFWLNHDGTYLWRQSLFYCGPDENGSVGWSADEAGIWSIDGKKVILRRVTPVGTSYSENQYFAHHREFTISGTRGHRTLVSGAADDMIVLKENDEPNKALVPTVMSVTPAADAPVAPATTAAHL